MKATIQVTHSLPLKNAGQLVYMLHGTPFAVSDEGRAALKKKPCYRHGSTVTQQPRWGWRAVIRLTLQV